MGDDAPTGRWMTYDEIAATRGIKRTGAVRLVQRQKWRRQAGNDGYARILVPQDELHPVRRTKAGASHPAPGGGDGGGDIAATLEAANRRADEANARADAALAVADRALAQLADLGERANRLERDLAAALNVADDARTAARKAEDAAEALRQADAARRGQGRWARLRAAWRGE